MMVSMQRKRFLTQTHNFRRDLCTFSTQIKNRIKLMNTTLIERELKSKNLLRRSDNFDLIKNTF